MSTSNNFAFICKKKYYISKIKEELVLEEAELRVTMSMPIVEVPIPKK